MKVTIIRCAGTVEAHDVDPDRVFAEVERLIGASMLDTVNLRDGRVMLVDDYGYETVTQPTKTGGIALVPVRARKPDNPRATAMYHEVCRPGTTHRIVGDVAIVNDSDFEEA